MLVSICGLLIVYYLSDRALLSGLRSHLEDLASVTANQIDADTHLQLAEKSTVPGSPAYTEAATPLLRLREEVSEIYYAYTLAFVDGKPVFVLDSTYYIKNQGDSSEVAMPGEVYDDAPEELFAAWKNSRVTSSETPYSDRWGTFVSAFAPIKDANGKVTGIVGVDISMRQLATRQKPVRLALAFAALACLVGSTIVGLVRARSYSKLIQRENELIIARADAVKGELAARAGEKSKSVFLATMSHEIRTPLNGVLGLTESLLLSPLTEEQEEQLIAIQHSGNLLLVMLNDILDFSKIEAGSLAVHSEAVCLHSLVESAVHLYRSSAKNKGLEIIIERASDAPSHVLADPIRASQIIGNLLSNAIKFTQRGEIRIMIGVDPDSKTMATLSVKDSGIGIPENRLGELFVPFSQLDTALNRQASGTGLGLSISRRLAELMDGNLTVKSEEGHGSCFTLSLPIAKELPKEIQNPGVPKLSISNASKLRVLVAEDVAINRQVISNMLKRMEIIPSFAEDGHVAVEMWREQRPNVILMDVQMPNMDGREATRRIRAESGDLTSPWIIALTGGVMEEDKQEAFKVGMNDFLSKPINQANLAAALTKALLEISED